MKPIWIIEYRLKNRGFWNSLLFPAKIKWSNHSYYLSFHELELKLKELQNSKSRFEFRMA